MSFLGFKVIKAPRNLISKTEIKNMNFAMRRHLFNIEKLLSPYYLFIYCFNIKTLHILKEVFYQLNDSDSFGWRMFVVQTTSTVSGDDELHSFVVPTVSAISFRPESMKHLKQK